MTARTNSLAWTRGEADCERKTIRLADDDFAPGVLTHELGHVDGDCYPWRGLAHVGWPYGPAEEQVRRALGDRQ